MSFWAVAFPLTVLYLLTFFTNLNTFLSSPTNFQDITQGLLFPPSDYFPQGLLVAKEKAHISDTVF